MKIYYRNTKNGLIYFSSLIIASLVILLVVFFVQMNGINNEVQNTIKNELKTYTFDIDDKVANVASDVLLLEDLIINRDIFNVVGGDTTFKTLTDKDELGEDLIDWITVKMVYDQIRIIDSNGQEIIRVNSNNGSPEIVEDALLQNKYSRYYFENSINLADDFIYMSKIDLNVENGEIEYIEGIPKVMLRIATPLYDDSNNKIGILIVNYLANNMFHDEDEAYSSLTTFEVINEDGYYLHSADTSKEFGFMYDDKLDELFTKYHDYPIFEESDSEISQEVFKGELYSSLIINNIKLSESISSNVGRPIEVFSDNGDIIIFGELELYDTGEFRGLMNLYFTLLAVLLVVMFAISRLIDEVVHTRLQHFKYLEYSSSHCGLTGLPNRSEIFKMITYLDNRKQHYTLLFLDLDKFKQVNDTFGHKIGDKVLIDSAKRFQDQVRLYDTVSRLGGDEFLILLKDLTEQNVIDRISEKIKEAIEVPFIYDDVECNIGVSIGIAIQKGEYTTEEIVHLADTKMYDDKKNRKR